jgi:hypothetical protein
MKSADQLGTFEADNGGNGNQGDVEDPSQKTDYQFIGTENMRYILSQELGLATNNNAFRKLNEKAESLGEGNPNAGRPNDYSFSALKGKIATEVFIDACADGLGNANIRSRLFPNGAQDPTVIYERFIGFTPEPAERAALEALASKLSPNTAHAGVCAAVLSSLEGLNRS